MSLLKACFRGCGRGRFALRTLVVFTCALIVSNAGAQPLAPSPLGYRGASSFKVLPQSSVRLSIAHEADARSGPVVAAEIEVLMATAKGARSLFKTHVPAPALRVAGADGLVRIPDLPTEVPLTLTITTWNKRRVVLDRYSGTQTLAFPDQAAVSRVGLRHALALAGELGQFSIAADDGRIRRQ